MKLFQVPQALDLDFLRFSVANKLGAKLRKRQSPRAPAPAEPFVAPGQNSRWHDGFVNSADNAHGLRAAFFRDQNGGVACVWDNAEKHFSGYPGLIHGGVSSALLDELMANAVLEGAGYFGVTLRSTVRWTRPIRVGEKVTGRAFITKRWGVLAVVEGVLFRADGKVAAEGRGLFMFPTWREFQRMAGVEIESEEIRQAFRPAAR